MTRTSPDAVLEGLFRRLSTATPADAPAIRAEAFARYLDLGRGGTAPNGLPYPSPTDPISEGASAIQALATALSGNIIGVTSRGVPSPNEISPGPPNTAPGYGTMAGMERDLITPGVVLVTWEFLTQNGNSGATREIYGAIAVDGAVNAASERHKMIGNANYDILGGSAVISVSPGQHLIALQTRASIGGAMILQSASLVIRAV